VPVRTCINVMVGITRSKVICYFLSISCLLNPPAAENSQPTPWDVTQTPLVSLSPPRIEVLAGSGDSRPSASQVATLSGIVRDSSGIVGDMAWVRPCGWDEVLKTKLGDLTGYSPAIS